MISSSIPASMRLERSKHPSRRTFAETMSLGKSRDGTRSPMSDQKPILRWRLISQSLWTSYQNVGREGYYGPRKGIGFLIRVGSDLQHGRGREKLLNRMVGTVAGR